MKPGENWDAETVSMAEALPGPILIPGGSGFVGANLFYRLLRLRDDVFVAARRPERSFRMLEAPARRCLALDVRDANSVKRVLQLLRPRIVINLAAYGGYSWQRDAELIHATNYIGVAHLADASRELGVAAFIQAGSSSEYGFNCRAPREDSGLQPNSDYAVAKAAASNLIHFYGRVHGLPALNLRFYSVYGSFEEPERLIPKVVAAGMEGRLPPFAAANISRDFVFVDDATAAIIRAAARAHRAPGASVNIASGVKTTLGEVAETARQVFDLRDAPVFGSMPNRAWDLPEWYGQPAYAEELLGWRCRTNLAEGLRRTAAFARTVSARRGRPVSLPSVRKVSAVVACHRDERAVPIMHARLTAAFQALGVDYEIIFVNDGSPEADGAAIDVLARMDGNVIGIHHSRAFGSQAAFLSGLEVFSGDAAVLLDGDLQDPPEVIPELVAKWVEGFDVVYGTRTQRTAPWHMRLLYKAFYRVFKLVADIPVPIDAGDFSLIDRKVVVQMLACGERDFFVRGIRAWVGFRQAGVPYHRPERAFGTSTNNFLKNIWWAKKGIFSFSAKPLHAIQGLGIGLFLLSLALIVFYMSYYFLFPEERSRGMTTITLLVLSLGGIQLISLSILGDYIGKITEEVKNRPRSIRARMTAGFETFETSDQMQEFIARQNRRRES